MLKKKSFSLTVRNDAKTPRQVKMKECMEIQKLILSLELNRRLPGISKTGFL